MSCQTDNGQKCHVCQVLFWSLAYLPGLFVSGTLEDKPLDKMTSNLVQLFNNPNGLLWRWSNSDKKFPVMAGLCVTIWSLSEWPHIYDLWRKLVHLLKWAEILYTHLFDH